MIATLLLASVLTLEPANDRFGLTEAGVVYGGAWEMSESFLADTSLDDAVRVDFSVEVEDYAEIEPEDPPEGLASLIPALFEDGTYGCWCWGDGRWMALRCPAIARSKSVEGRIELRHLGEEQSVSYFIKVEDTYVQLRTASGRCWFRSSAATAVCGLATRGAGRFTSFTGFDGTIDPAAYALTTYPGTNRTTIDGETALTSDLMVLMEEDGDGRRLAVHDGGGESPHADDDWLARISQDESRPDESDNLRSQF